MKIPVYSESQFEELLSLPPGEYDFKVISAEEKKSQAGNDMTVVDLKLRNGYQIRDWITIIDLPDRSKFTGSDEEFRKRKAAHGFSVQKIRDFLLTLKLPYEENSFTAANIMNKQGKVMIKIEKDDQNKPRPRVNFYIAPNALKMTEEIQKPMKSDKVSTEIDDDIPF